LPLLCSAFQRTFPFVLSDLERVGVVLGSCTLFQAMALEMETTQFACKDANTIKYLAYLGTSRSCYSAMLNIRYVPPPNALPLRLTLEP
jgi:hypothetical protein